MVTDMSLLGKLRFTDSGIIYSIRKAVVGTKLGRSLANRFLYRPGMDDKAFIIKQYKRELGETPDLDHPRNFNEKNNWRKLHDRRPVLTDMVDKYKVKSIIAQRVGAGHTFPLIGVWDIPEDIDFDSLPNQFVLKTNHSGGIIACRDKAAFDREGAVAELKELLASDYFVRFREWAYRDVERKVICEKYMGENLTDYKNYCFNGKLMYTFVWENRSQADGRKPVATFCGAYDRNWKRTDIELGYLSSDKVVPCPPGYEKMVEIAEKMAEDTIFVRVDCYNFSGHVYVGEMTMYPWAGFMQFKDRKWNDRFGELEKLPYEQ